MHGTEFGKSAREAADVLLEFRQQSAASPIYDDVMDATERAVTAFGGAGFIYWTSLRSTVERYQSAGEFHRDTNMITARGPIFLKAFEALYLRRRGLVMDDPTVDHLLVTHSPFTSDEVMGGMNMNRRQKLNLVMMHRFGLYHDVFLPTHTAARYQVLYVFALGKAPEIGERLLLNRPWLVQLADILVGAVADHVNFERYESSSTYLSIREQECLVLMARGMTNREIAKTLGIRDRTVKFHADNVMRKLGASTRAEAVAIAARANWLTN